MDVNNRSASKKTAEITPRVSGRVQERMASTKCAIKTAALMTTTKVNNQVTTASVSHDV